MRGLGLALPLLGALLFRIRGGWLSLPSTTLGRLAWSCGMALGVAGATLDAWALALAPALFVGCVLPWWGSLDLGRNEGEAWRDALVMTARGVLWVLPAAGLVAWWRGWPAVGLVVAGLACAPAYALAWRIPSNAPGFARGPELGEVIFGAAIGAALGLVVI